MTLIFVLKLSCHTLNLKLNVRRHLSKEFPVGVSMLLGLPMANERIERPILRFAFGIYLFQLGCQWTSCKSMSSV